MRTNYLKQALDFATKKHKGQMYGDKPFIVHPLATVGILEAVVPQDGFLLAAGYLHDTIEDTNTTYEDLKEIFNEDIANLVKEVTKSGYNIFPNLKTRRGAILKYADRLHNLVSMESWTPKEQQKYIEKSRFWK